MYSIFSHSLFDENSHLHQYLSSSTRFDLLLSMIIAIIIALISDWYTNWHQWELRAMLGHLSSREQTLTPLMITTHTPLSIIFFIQDDKAKDTLFSQQISICLLLTEQTAVSNCRLAFVCSLQSKLQFQYFHPGKWRLWMIALDFFWLPLMVWYSFLCQAFVSLSCSCPRFVTSKKNICSYMEVTTVEKWGLILESFQLQKWA